MISHARLGFRPKCLRGKGQLQPEDDGMGKMLAEEEHQGASQPAPNNRKRRESRVGELGRWRAEAREWKGMSLPAAPSAKVGITHQDSDSVCALSKCACFTSALPSPFWGLPCRACSSPPTHTVPGAEGGIHLPRASPTCMLQGRPNVEKRQAAHVTVLVDVCRSCA